MSPRCVRDRLRATAEATRQKASVRVPAHHPLWAAVGHPAQRGELVLGQRVAVSHDSLGARRRSCLLPVERRVRSLTAAGRWVTFGQSEGAMRDGMRSPGPRVWGTNRVDAAIPRELA